MNPCKLKELKVIDNALLVKCVKDQGPKGEAGRLSDMEAICLDEVLTIKLEFQNILRIDHLWVLTSLTTLNLNNNYIEKIENLDSLIHLVELNLSFNKISKIENLNELINLKKLSLFDNEISKLENMDSLTKLSVFSIGKNRIDDLNNVVYLRQFTQLKSLNMVGNPCAEMEDFRLFIATFLPQVVYYEYKLIYDMERDLGQDIFSKKLRDLLENEEKEAEKRQRKLKEIADAELHASSFVEYLNTTQLFDSLFVDDKDGKCMLLMGEEAKEFYDEYEQQFMEACKQIFDNGQRQFLIRKEEEDQFRRTVDEAKRNNQEDSIRHMELFIEKKAVVFLKLRNLQVRLNDNQFNYDEFIDRCDLITVEFGDLLHDIWKALMKLELELFEQLEELNQTFEHSMAELVNNFIESSQALFTQIRDLETKYSENIGDYALKFQTQLTLNEIEFQDVPEQLKNIMEDKDVLHNALATSHDMHMQIIDNREDTLIGNARKWLEDLVESLTTNEIKRNRGKVLEINHFLDIQREEFEELNSEYAPGAVVEENADEM